MLLLRLGYKRFTFLPPTPLFLVLPPSPPPLALLSAPFWWRKLPRWELPVETPTGRSWGRLSSSPWGTEVCPRPHTGAESRWILPQLSQQVRRRLGLTPDIQLSHGQILTHGVWHMWFGHMGLTHVVLGWGTSQQRMNTHHWYSQPDIWRPIWDLFLGIYMLTTKSSEEVRLDRNFINFYPDKIQTKFQTNHIKVELSLFLKLLYPTFSAHSWETEGLSLSQSPRDIREGPGPQPNAFLHLKCPQSSILTSLAI